MEVPDAYGLIIALIPTYIGHQLQTSTPGDQKEACRGTAKDGPYYPAVGW